MPTNTLELLERLSFVYHLIPSRNQQSPYEGPIWDHHTFFFDADDHYADIGYFHELAHWVMADTWQHELPDFGLGRHVNAHDRGKDDSRQYKNVGWTRSWHNEERVDKEDTRRQEELATEAIGLYDYLFGAQHTQATYEVLSDFSAWGSFSGNNWSQKDNKTIVAEFTKCGILSSNERQAAFEHLERWSNDD